MIAVKNVVLIATRNVRSREDAPNPEVATATDAMTIVYAVMKKFANVPPAAVVHADVTITNAVRLADAE